jgi:DNA-binding response OmpR family regulator
VKKILLVEDDPTMLELLSTLFMLEGFEVATMLGEEAILESVVRNSPDVILMDVHLRLGGGKEVSGFDLLKLIRSEETTRDKKIIMYSGMDFRIKSREEGADGFILKPFMPDELMKIIKELVE